MPTEVRTEERVGPVSEPLVTCGNFCKSDNTRVAFKLPFSVTDMEYGAAVVVVVVDEGVVVVATVEVATDVVAVVVVTTAEVVTPAVVWVVVPAAVAAV